MLGSELQSGMLMSHRNKSKNGFQTCPYGCCDSSLGERSDKRAKRRLKRRERQNWRYQR